MSTDIVATTSSMMAKPDEQIAYASDIARTLSQIIERQHLYKDISGKKYVFVEGWTTLAALRGCTPRELSNERDPERDGVYVATVELVNAEGRVIGVASAECGDADELSKDGKPVWASRPAYARRSMANTRATSKVCRQVFSWIMVLAGYTATPAEEMDDESIVAAATRPAAPAKRAPSPAPDDDRHLVPRGKHKGEPWSVVPDSYLRWAIEKTEGVLHDGALRERKQREELAAHTPIDDLPDEPPF